MKKTITVLLPVTFTLAISGCAGSNKPGPLTENETNALEGGAVGAAGGAVIGALAGSPAIGAAVGGAVGATTGALWNDINSHSSESDKAKSSSRE